MTLFSPNGMIIYLMDSINYFHLFDNYSLAAKLLPQLLGLIYFFAYFAHIFQIKGMIGSNGVLPLTRFLHGVKSRFGKRAYLYVPSVFWLDSKDRTLQWFVALALFLSVLLMCNIAPPVCLLFLFILQLSMVSAGQEFLSFGWEMFLLEITCNTFFLSLTDSPNPFIWASLNLLLFRFHFQGGISKILSRDKTWRDLTAISYHYLTQPLPNTVAWYIHKFPMWFHKLSCAMMFVVELIVPFAIFAPDSIRFYTFVLLVGLQFAIWLTGNLSFLNYMTAALCIILLSNNYLEPIFGPAPTIHAAPLPLDLFISFVGLALLVLQCLSLWQYFHPNRHIQKILGPLSQFHIINRYGIFAVMTTKRYEIIVEGSEDGVHWEEYLFKYKPSEVKRRPRRIAPYQPRLDWRAWFLPFSSYYNERWFQLFLERLLEGSEDVLQLFRYSPFKDKPPLYIRAIIYDYTFTSWEEKKQTGNWWNRKYVGTYSPTMKLR